VSGFARTPKFDSCCSTGIPIVGPVPDDTTNTTGIETEPVASLATRLKFTAPTSAVVGVPEKVRAKLSSLSHPGWLSRLYFVLATSD
jgi:hypothetical protein